MAPVEFKSEYFYRVGPVETRVYPAGWRGEVEAEVAKAARKAGALVAHHAKTTAEPKAKVTQAKTPAKAPVKVAKDKS